MDASGENGESELGSFLRLFGYYFFIVEKDILYKKLVMWIRRVQSRGLSGGGGDKSHSGE
jgi:hypothetical protein